MFSEWWHVIVQNIIWSTGFVQDYKWIEVEKCNEYEGFPDHTKGMSE